MIREIEYEELKEASDLLWKSFYEAEKNNHSMTGMENFRDLTSPVSLSINTFDGSVSLYGYYEERLLAVGAVKDQNHILLLYVLPEAQKTGIGARLLSFLEDQCLPGRITVNSSDGAVLFYLKHGYKAVGVRSVDEELISTPMEKYKSI